MFETCFVIISVQWKLQLTVQIKWFIIESFSCAHIFFSFDIVSPFGVWWKQRLMEDL